MEWNADLYREKHGFVAEYGKALIDLVNRDKGQVLLDLGCGPGELTVALSQKGAKVIGIDASPAMIRQAKKNYPSLSFYQMDATKLSYRAYFDTVFSNAVFHWIPDQAALLASICTALKENGRLLCEFGAHGNISRIQQAFSEAALGYHYTYTSPFFFPTKEEYAKMLEQAGFQVSSVVEFDRPTALKDGRVGLRNWVTQFFAEDIAALAPAERNAVLLAMEEKLAPFLWREGTWYADYRRIRVDAKKAAN